MMQNENARVVGSERGRNSNRLAVNGNPSRPLQQKDVLILVHADYLEVFGEGVSVCIQRVPTAFSREAEVTAENVAELLLPLRFRPLYRRDRLVKTESTSPLLPTALAQSLAVKDSITRLNALASEGGTV